MKAPLPPSPSGRFASLVRDRIEQGGERVWRLEDFRDQPFMGVAQALSRLARAGLIERLSKGVYYRARQTVFGDSRPTPAAIGQLAARSISLFPSGTAAANLLGFTTQTARRGAIATNAPSLPRKLVGQDTVIHTRRPEAWSRLTEAEAALLDFLRRGGRDSELSPADTVRKTLALLSESDRYAHLVNVARTEPPRVRALLGALGQQLEASPQTLAALRDSLNPASRFDFGLFAALPDSRAWQAKGQG